jgi:hypothetical protein
MNCMDKFIAKHAGKIEGTLSCFDRILFRGYLPFFSGAAMATFLDSRGIERHELKSFLLRQAFLLKDHARRLAEREHRPSQYFGERVRKEELARQIAERDGIREGLVCIFSTLEPCRSYALRWRKATYVDSARRKCLFLYYYFMDRELGLIHVRIQTWFPLQIQVYVNGHEWLARKLTRHGIRYAKEENAFLAVDDLRRAQTFADRFASLDWVQRLDRLARAVNPLLPELLAPMTYYWVTAQAEYATDVLFKSRRDLEDLMPRLVEHSSLHFSAKDVLSFLGRKLTGHFQGEVVTDRFDVPLRGRLPGCRVKHRMKQNWLKMYNKAGFVLRIETVLNQPEEFRVRRRVRRGRRRVTAWVPLRKSVAYLFRYREISLQSNSRYLNALAQVDDPTSALRALDKITTRKQSPTIRPVRVFNPLARPDSELFAALMSGDHALHGFTNRDLRDKLAPTVLPLHQDPQKRSAQVSRLLHRLHVYGLLRKVPHSRRWHVSPFGHRVMSTALTIRHKEFPNIYADAA